jgi:glycosyltransferase involved in cell wall biosynthesis
MVPIVSVVSPSFNQAEFLDAAIRSVVTQEGDFYLDYVIQDGQSNDGSIDIIKKWDSLLGKGVDISRSNGLAWRVPATKKCEIKCRGLSFRWRSGRDNGQCQAINAGFDLAIGELGGWINSDDALLPMTIQNALEAFIVQRRVVFGMARAVDEHGATKWTQSFWKRFYSFYDSFYRDYTPPQPSVFFPVNLFRQVGGLNEELHYMLDVDLWQRMLLSAGPFAYVPQLWSLQTYHPASKSMSGGALFRKFQDEKKLVWARRKEELGIRGLLWIGLRHAEVLIRKTIDTIKLLRRRLLGFLCKTV